MEADYPSQGVNVARRITAAWIAVDNNPLMRMAEVNGDPEDLRDMPREVQEIAFETGMIPYIPDHRE